MRKLFDGLIMIIIFSAISACSFGSRNKVKHKVPHDLYELAVIYDQERKGFSMELTSTSSEALCVTRMSWFNEKGQHYFNKSDRVYLLTDGGRCSVPF